MSRVSRGVWAATLTPMNEDLSVNHDMLVSHIARLFGNECDGVALLGTTGEANSLSVSERLSLIECVGDQEFPADRIMIGVGCCAAPDTIELSKAAIAAGYPNLLMLPPFFYKGVSEDGIFQSYAHVIEKLNDDRANIIVYDIPPQTGLEISVDLLVRLHDAFPENIVGVKDSSGKWEDMKETCDRLPEFATFAGTEKYLLPILRAGGAGCISATANVTSRNVAMLYDQWKTPAADSLQEFVTDLRMTLQAYPAAPALKELMATHTCDLTWRNMRPPIVGLENEKQAALYRDLERLEFDTGALSTAVELRTAS